MIHWLYFFFGLDNLSGSHYGFWSGVGSDIGELAIIAGLYGVYRRHNCHVGRCWRLGRYTVTGTPYVVCKLHHPTVPNGQVTYGRIYQAHKDTAALAAHSAGKAK